MIGEACQQAQHPPYLKSYTADVPRPTAGPPAKQIERIFSRGSKTPISESVGLLDTSSIIDVSSKMLASGPPRSCSACCRYPTTSRSSLRRY